MNYTVHEYSHQEVNYIKLNYFAEPPLIEDSTKTINAGQLQHKNITRIVDSHFWCGEQTFALKSFQQHYKWITIADSTGTVPSPSTYANSACLSAVHVYIKQCWITKDQCSIRKSCLSIDVRHRNLILQLVLCVRSMNYREYVSSIKLCPSYYFFLDVDQKWTNKSSTNLWK